MGLNNTNRKMFIKIKDIIEKYPNIKIKGIIHIGAHEAEEYEDYKEVGIKKIIWVEGNPDLIQNLKTKFEKDDDSKVYNQIIFDDVKTVNFKISNNLQSSSILNLKEHKNLFPDVFYTKEIVSETKRFDQLAKEEKINMDYYNFLNVDVQGADLNVILSFGNLLDKIDMIYSEINTIEVYEGCTILCDFDKVMENYGFIRTMTHIYQGGGWGDALYVKSNNI